MIFVLAMLFTFVYVVRTKTIGHYSLLITRNTNTPCRNSFDAMLQVLVIFSVLSNLFVTLFTYGYLVELINSYSLNLAPTVT